MSKTSPKAHPGRLMVYSKKLSSSFSKSTKRRTRNRDVKTISRMPCV